MLLYLYSLLEKVKQMFCELAQEGIYSFHWTSSRELLKPFDTRVDMRILFEKGKQRALIAERKTGTWQELCDRYGLAYGRVKDWYYELNCIPDWAYVMFDPALKYERYIIDVLPEHWGQVKGGENSLGTTKEMVCPEKCSQLAEFVGIILGDGHITQRKEGTHQVVIAGDAQHELPYFQYISRMVLDLFGLETVIHTAYTKDHNGLFIRITSKRLVSFLLSIGLFAGDKIRNNQGIPEWIFENEEYVRACIRGLMDTDGSIHLMSKRDGLKRISFTNYCVQLLDDVYKGLHSLGYHPTRTGRKLYLSRQAEVETYLKEIGFANSKHLLRNASL